LILKAESARAQKAKIGWAVLACVACLVGALIKMTVLIVLVAAFIWLLLSRKWKDLLVLVLVAAIVIGAGFAGFDKYMYTSHIDEVTAEKMNQPIWYWLDLAVIGNGMYNHDLFMASYNISGKEAKAEFLKEVFGYAIEYQGVDALLDLAVRKPAIVFGNGAYGIAEFLDDRPAQQRDIHRYILTTGDKYYNYVMATTGIFLAIQLLMLFSLNFKKRNLAFVFPQLCAFGIMFFLLFWEIKSCYMINFVAFIFICASGGLYQIVCESGGVFKSIRSLVIRTKK